MSVILFNSFSSNCAVLMKVPRAFARGLLTCSRRKTLKKDPPGDNGGFQKNFYPQILFFMTLGQPLLGEKYVTQKRKRKEERTWVCARLTLRSAPIDTRRIFSAHMSERGRARRGGKKYENFLIKFISISGDSKHFSFFSGKKNPKK